MHLPNMFDAKIRNKSKVNYIYESRVKSDVFEGKKYFLRTYGCQMNVHDSEEISALLENLGYEKVEDYTKADLIIINTCAIRENAHDKVFGFLGRCKHLKKTNKDLILGLCGCMAQEESVVDEIREKHPYIDIIFGTHNMNELPKMLLNFYGKQLIEVYSKEGDVIEFGNLYKRDSKVSAWVNIMYGCDKFCTYCIVPYTRGKERSRKMEDILRECQDLVNKGYMEITLLGQNVNAYGKDLKDDSSFALLLESVAKLGIPRLRFTTSHPWDFSDEMIDIIAKYDNIMPAIHLPVQSGNDEILRLMGRRYTSEQYKALVDKMKARIPNLALTTDIIVGFPNETYEQFLDTLKMVEYVKYDGAFTFIYSPRVGTPAARMVDNVTSEEKHKRFDELVKVVEKEATIKADALVGQTVKVLVDGASKKNKDVLSGYSETNKLVHFHGSADLVGKIVKVKIKESHLYSVIGELVND